MATSVIIPLTINLTVASEGLLLRPHGGSVGGIHAKIRARGRFAA